MMIVMNSELEQMSHNSILQPVIKEELDRNQNIHPMVIRGKTGIFKPKAYLTRQLAKLTAATLSQTEWRIAMEEEYQVLIKNLTWKLVPLPPGRHFVG